MCEHINQVLDLPISHHSIHRRGPGVQLHIKVKIEIEFEVRVFRWGRILLFIFCFGGEELLCLFHDLKMMCCSGLFCSSSSVDGVAKCGDMVDESVVGGIGL